MKFLYPQGPLTPLEIRWVIPYLNNDTLIWKGGTSAVMDANGDVWTMDLLLESPWYYCVACDRRQSFGDNYCPKCGLKLNWENLDRDPSEERKIQELWEAKIAETKSDLQTSL